MTVGQQMDNYDDLPIYEYRIVDYRFFYRVRIHQGTAGYYALCFKGQGRTQLG